MQTVWSKKYTAPRKLGLVWLLSFVSLSTFIKVLAAKSQPEAWSELPSWKK